MSMFKTAGSLLLVCSDARLPRWAARRWPAAWSSSRRRPPRWVGPNAFMADPDAHLWGVIHHPLYGSGPTGDPKFPRRLPVGASRPPALPAAFEDASELELGEVRTRAGDLLAFELTPEPRAGAVGELRVNVRDGVPGRLVQLHRAGDRIAEQ